MHHFKYDETLVNHAPTITMPEGNYPLVAPVYHSVKYSFDQLEDLEKVFRREQEGFFYSRLLNPTVRQLEILLAQLQKTEECLAVSSGIAAISTAFLSLLQQGDHVILFLESYRPTRVLVRQFLKKYGVESTLLSIHQLPHLKDYVQPNTKVMMIESPTNPMTFIADLTHFTQVARDHGIISILDNTFAGPHQHQQIPVDLYVHSLTKFVSGHGDVMGGAILGTKKLIDRLRRDSIELGPVLDPGAAYAFMKGLKTYFIRMKAQSSNAFHLAQKLEQDPRLKKVYYPGLPSHPQHDLCLKQMSDGGNMISFTINHPQNIMHQFINNLKVVKLAASLGSTESLIAPCELLFSGDFNSEEKKISGIETNTLRLSVGIEHLDDLWADIDQALKKVPADLWD